LDEFIRRYHIIFDTRDIQEIRQDYFEKKWLSKEELYRFIEHEEQDFVKEYTYLQQQHLDLLNGFNLNALANYRLLERREQGKLQK